MNNSRMMTTIPALAALLLAVVLTSVSALSQAPVPPADRPDVDRDLDPRRP